MSETALQLVLSVVSAVIALTLHEAAHGYAALALGDDTARSMGRLSLNPLRHIDPVGTVLLPGILLAGQLLFMGRIAFMFGWARPVPVAAWRFADPRRGMMVVAAAGPAANFLLAWGAALALHASQAMPGDLGWTADQFLGLFMISNLVFGLFNLLPIPPLDGGRILVGLLPQALAERWASLERAGIVIVIVGLILLPQALREFGIRFDPLGAALRDAVPWTTALLLRLAGHDV